MGCGIKRSQALSIRSQHFGEASPVAILAMEEVLAKTVAEGSKLFKGVVQYIAFKMTAVALDAM